MNNPIAKPDVRQPNKSKKNIVVYLITAIFFVVASYNVYSFFIEKQRVKAEKEAQRVEALELKRQQKLEAERQAELEQARKLQELEQQRLDAEKAIQQSKLESQQRIALYDTMKQAKKQARENERLQRRVDDAQTLHNPEGVPRNILQAMERATHLTIQNNPDDYRGDYTPQSILKTAKLTQQGANSLMMFAMVSDDLKVLQAIMDLGYDVNAQNKLGYTALMFASAYNSPEVTSFLIEQGAKKQITEYVTKGNALHVASRYNPKPNAIAELVKHGFDLDLKDKHGNTPLLLAVKYNQNVQVVQKLIELGADITASDATGNVAYSHALERTQKRVPMGRFKRISLEYEKDVLQKLKP